MKIKLVFFLHLISVNCECYLYESVNYKNKQYRSISVNFDEGSSTDGESNLYQNILNDQVQIF